MHRLSVCAGLAAGLLTGCASAPQPEDFPEHSPAAAQFHSGEGLRAAGGDAEGAEDIVIEGQVDAQAVFPDSTVVCRDMLQHASNVIRRRCMTVAAWRRYEVAEAQRAQAILRSWQGSPYAGF